MKFKKLFIDCGFYMLTAVVLSGVCHGWVGIPTLKQRLLDSTDIFKAVVVAVKNTRETCDYTLYRKEGELAIPPNPGLKKFAERIEVTFQIQQTYKGILEKEFVYKAGFSCKTGGGLRVHESGRARWPEFREGQKVFIFARREPKRYEASFFFEDRWKSRGREGQPDEFQLMVERLGVADQKIRSAKDEDRLPAYNEMAGLLEEYHDYDSLAFLYQYLLEEKYQARKTGSGLIKKGAALCVQYGRKADAPSFLDDRVEDDTSFLSEVADLMKGYGKALHLQGKDTQATRPLCLAASYAPDASLAKEAQAILKNLKTE